MKIYCHYFWSIIIRLYALLYSVYLQKKSFYIPLLAKKCYTKFYCHYFLTVFKIYLQKRHYLPLLSQKRYTKFYGHYFLTAFSFIYKKVILYISSKPKTQHKVLLSLLLVNHPFFIHSSEINIKE